MLTACALVVVVAIVAQVSRHAVDVLLEVRTRQLRSDVEKAERIALADVRRELSELAHQVETVSRHTDKLAATQSFKR